MGTMNRSTQKVSYNIFASCRLVEFMSSTDRKRKKTLTLKSRSSEWIEVFGSRHLKPLPLLSFMLFWKLWAKSDFKEPDHTWPVVFTAKQQLGLIVSLSIREFVNTVWSRTRDYRDLLDQVASPRKYRTRNQRLPSCITVCISIRKTMKIRHIN